MAVSGGACANAGGAAKATMQRCRSVTGENRRPHGCLACTNDFDQGNPGICPCIGASGGPFDERGRWSCGFQRVIKPRERSHSLTNVK